MAPRQTLDDGETQALMAGKRVAGIWPDTPSKAAQKGEPWMAAIGPRPMANDARWTLKRAKAKPDADTREPGSKIAIPVFGDKSHIATDRRDGVIRTAGDRRRRP